MKQVLIIGAGISGITAGRILAENNYQVTILEKGTILEEMFIALK